MSAIWDYFVKSEKDPKYAKCLTCHKDFSLGSLDKKQQTLNSLFRHMQTFHPNKWSDFSKKRSDPHQPRWMLKDCFLLLA